MTANGDEIKPGMHLVTDDGDKMFVFSLPSLYIVADQGSWEDNLAYAAECIRTGQGEFYPAGLPAAPVLGNQKVNKQHRPAQCGPFSVKE